MKTLKAQIYKYPIIYTLLFYGIYIFGFFLIEQVNQRPAILIYSVFDDWIPFSKYAVVPYCMWFVEIAGILLFLYFKKSRDIYIRNMALILSSMMCALPIFCLFPTAVDLRPSSVIGDDILSKLVRFIYFVDDSRNVCPSLHVTECYLMIKIWNQYIGKKKGLPMMILNVIICISTLFLKQHSVIDVVVGLLYGILFKYLFDLIVSKKLSATDS